MAMSFPESLPGVLCAGRIDYSVIENFSDAMRMREDADYGCFYNAESAEFVVNAAECALRTANAMLK